MRGTLCSIIFDGFHRCNRQKNHIDPDRHMGTAACIKCSGLNHVAQYTCLVCGQNDGRCFTHLRDHEVKCFQQFVRNLPEQYIERIA